MAGRGRGEVSYGQRIAIALVAVLGLTLFVASSLYTRTGRGAADIELARLVYTQAVRVAVETESSLSSQGKATPKTQNDLSRAALDLDASLVLFLEADTLLAVAHGPSLQKSLALLRNADAQGSFSDSGQTPWVPEFGDPPDPERFPRRGGRLVRVQTSWPYAVEMPVAGNMTLRLMPLSVRPLRDGGYRSALFVLFILMALASVLISLRLARPVEEAAVALERMASTGGTWSVPARGIKEMGWIARAATRLRQRAVDAETQQREVLRSLGRILVEPMARMKEGVTSLSGARLGATRRAALSELERDTGNLHRTVSALWQWNSLEAGSLEPDIRDVDLRRTLQEVTRLFVERRAPDLEIEVTVDDGVEETVAVDPLLFAGVVAAVLDNTRLHGAGPVQIHASRAHTKVEISIVDSGDGVPYDQLGSIFQPFQGQRRGVHVGGLGLGLRLARLVLGLLRGGLTARNHPDGGFEIAMWLPAPPIRVSEVDRSLRDVHWVADAAPALAVRKEPPPPREPPPPEPPPPEPPQDPPPQKVREEPPPQESPEDPPDDEDDFEP